MPRNTLSQSQAKITSTHLDAPQTNTEHANETGSEDNTGSDNDTDYTKVSSSEVAKHLPKQINEAPMDQHNERRARRLLGKEDKTTYTPAPYQSFYRQSPHKMGRSRRDGHSRRKEEQLPDTKATDSPLLQVTYDDPKSRKKREKLLPMIHR